jgi:hypothetical protein
MIELGKLIDPKTDDLSYFAHWYLTCRAKTKILPPSDENTLVFIDGLYGITLLRQKPFQVQLFICKPNLYVPEHTHPNVDSYEVALYGMTLRHCGKTYKEKDLQPYHTIRVKTNHPHGGVASKYGGAFMSIQQWLNDTKITSVGLDWVGETMGKKHIKQSNIFKKTKKNWL